MGDRRVHLPPTGHGGGHGRGGVTGHRDTWVLGGIPKEGSLFNLIRGVVPTVKAVHFPMSGSCRFNCYISIDKKVDGETKQAALAARQGTPMVAILWGRDARTLVGER